MSDCAHQWGGDLSFSPTGDLAVASGTLLTEQRVLRRLLTAPGEDLWDGQFGAGLAGFVGDVTDPNRIRAVIRSQIFREPAVSASPEPVIDVIGQPTGAYVHVRYVDAASGLTGTLSLTAGA